MHKLSNHQTRGWKLTTVVNSLLFGCFVHLSALFVCWMVVQIEPPSLRDVDELSSI